MQCFAQSIKFAILSVYFSISLCPAYHWPHNFCCDTFNVLISPFFVLMLFDVTLSLSLFFLHLTLGNFSLFFHYICVFCIWTSLLYMIAVIFTVFIDFVDFNTLNNHLYGVFFPIELYIHMKFYCCCCCCFHSLHIIFILIEQYHLNPLYCIDFNIHIYIFNWILLELLVCSMEEVVEKKESRIWIFSTLINIQFIFGAIENFQLFNVVCLSENVLIWN